MLRQRKIKKIVRRQRKKIIGLYKKLKIFFHQSVVVIPVEYNVSFTLSLPQKQQYYNIFEYKTNKRSNFSVGLFLSKFGKRGRFFKRTARNIPGVVLNFKKNYKKLIQYIFIFFIKNFSYRQFLFFKKFNEILKPNIYYLWHKQSYIPRFLPKRRIKRRVLHLLEKSQ